jgi:hypothetical protein
MRGGSHMKEGMGHYGYHEITKQAMMVAKLMTVVLKPLEPFKNEAS